MAVENTGYTAISFSNLHLLSAGHILLARMTYIMLDNESTLLIYTIQPHIKAWPVIL